MNRLALTTFVLLGCAKPPADVAPPAPVKEPPAVRKDDPKRVFFGDTHLHTSFSADAGLFGNRLGPDKAYQFAKGEAVKSSTGLDAQLSRPLDFLMVSDHAENLGLPALILESNADLLSNAWGRKIHAKFNEGDRRAAFWLWANEVKEGRDPLEGDTKLTRTMWDRIIAAAERHNDPGAFTTFIGFEWTSAPGGNNLHRNVMFRDGGEKARTVLPFSTYDSDDPEDLWGYLARYEKATGGKVLAIPHNGNLSNGLMFAEVTDRGYAERRARWEPLYEVTQTKGDAEAHPSLSPTDEFAAFETWDEGSFGEAKKPGMIEGEYAREAFKRGLATAQRVGANPFKLGLIGSTDSHTSLAGAPEGKYFGAVSVLEPSDKPLRFEAKMAQSIQHYRASASGLAAVWARANTREALWDAMARRETYATTGTRLTVRVFAGWEFAEEDLERKDLSAHGYAHGVPMGGDLEAAGQGPAPTFVVQAMRDPEGAHLDRVQIIKGWVDAQGAAHERIFDVAVAGGRTIGSDGRCRTPVGNTVDAKAATYDNSIGAAALSGFWKDETFEPKQRAFYYVRVLEIPTPRWTTFDVRDFGVKQPKDAPIAIQERAYTSPIWYTPSV